MTPWTTHRTHTLIHAKLQHSLAAEEEEVQPQPGEDQHDDCNGEAEDEPRAEVYHLCIRIAAGKRGKKEHHGSF